MDTSAPKQPAYGRLFHPPVRPYPVRDVQAAVTAAHATIDNQVGGQAEVIQPRRLPPDIQSG